MLIWSLPITVVNIIIILMNKAAVVVRLPLSSFVITEHQNNWHCSGSSTFILKRNLLHYNHVSFCNNRCNLSKCGSLQPNSYKPPFHWQTNDPPKKPANICFCQQRCNEEIGRHVAFSFLETDVEDFFFSKSHYTFPQFCLMQYNSFYYNKFFLRLFLIMLQQCFTFAGCFSAGNGQNFPKLQ